MSEAWYDELRRQWKPDAVRLLLVGESAPDPGAEERRFFYAPKLDRRDNLFPRGDRGMYEPIPRGSTGQPKRPWLERLRADGVYLVDSVPFPVDKLTSGERRRARREHVTALVEQARALDPRGVIVCHAPTFAEAGLPLLHDAPLPFPLGNTRARFVAGVRAVLPGSGRPR
jgi:hypothetical protein